MDGRREKAFRTLGASVILAGVVVAGYVQMRASVADNPVDIAPGVPTSQAEPTTLETGETEEPFVYRIGVLAGITTDNFWAFYGEEPSVWNSYILGPTKPALFTLDPSQGVLRPELSSADVTPEQDGDGWLVTIVLSDDYRWSDGRPITADDFVFTYETVRELDLGGSWAESFPETIATVRADTAYQLRIEFTERPNLSVWPHGVGLAPIMARHIWERKVDGISSEQLYEMSGEGDVGGGPLTIIEVSDDVLVSHANTGYPGTPAPDVVEYRVFANEESAVDALAFGDIDSILTPKGLTPDQVARLEGGDSIEVLTSPANGIRYLGFNLEREPMADRAFRTALALLLERETLSEEIPQSGEPALAFVPEANAHWFDLARAEENWAPYQGNINRRLQKALKGLRDAGYTWATPPKVKKGVITAGDGLEIGGMAPQPLTILTTGDAYDPARPEYVARVAETIKLLGFDVRPVETDFDTVVDLAFTRDEEDELQYDMYMLGWTLGNPALPGFYGPLFASDGVQNNTGYSSEELDLALEAYEGAFRAQDAREALWAIEQRLSMDLPYLLLYTPQIHEVYRSDRVGFDIEGTLGGLQARLGGIGDVRPTD